MTSPRQTSTAWMLARRGALLLIATMAAAWLLAAAAAWQRSRLAARLATEATTAPAAASRVLIRELAALGPDAIEPLVQLSVQENLPAAATAREALLNLFTAWELPARGSRSRGEQTTALKALAQLANALDRRAAQFGPQGRPWAARLALRLLRCADRLPPAEAWKLAAAADHVLDVCRRQPGQLRRGRQIAAATPARGVASAPSATSALPTAPWNAAPNPPAPPVRVGLSNAPATVEMRIVPGGILSEPEIIAQSPAPAGSNSARSESAKAAPKLADPTAPAMQAARPLPTAPVVADAAVDVPTPREIGRALARLRQTSSRELRARLPAASRFEALAIRQVLDERGVPAAPAPAASSTATSAPSAGQLMSNLAEMPAGRALARLRSLANDDDPDVRLEAIAILATTSDPQAAAILQRRAVEDSDPRVAELAAKILKSQQR